jgi:PAS domain-containing protein
VSEIASRRSLVIGIVLAIGILAMGIASGIWLWLAIPIAIAVVTLCAIFQREVESIEADLTRKSDQNETLAEIARTQKSAVDAFADGLDIGIFVCDDRAQIAYANRFAQLLFGFENPLARSLLAVTLSVELEQLALSERLLRLKLLLASRKSEYAWLAHGQPTIRPNEFIYRC